MADTTSKQHGGLVMNVYVWGASEIRQTLRCVIAPLLLECIQRDPASHVWYDFFVSRGPHIHVQIITREAAWISFAAERVERYCQEHPSTHDLSAEDLTSIHHSGRGRIQNGIDARPGLAANNTVQRLDAGDLRLTYPLSEFAEADYELLRSIQGKLTLQALHDAVGPASHINVILALRLFVAVDVALATVGMTPLSFWYYHLCSLLVNVPKAGIPGDYMRRLLAQTFTSKRLRVLASKRQLFQRESQSDEMKSAHAPDSALFELTLLFNRRSAGAFKVVRELLHTFCKQVGITTPQEIALTVFFNQTDDVFQAAGLSS